MTTHRYLDEHESTIATVLKFNLWQRFDSWAASVDALPEDFCDDYEGTGRTPSQALGTLLAAMARDGKVLIDAHWIEDGWRAWPEGKINRKPLDKPQQIGYDGSNADKSV